MVGGKSGSRRRIARGATRVSNGTLQWLWPWLALAWPLPIIVRRVLSPARDGGGPPLNLPYLRELSVVDGRGPRFDVRWRFWVALVAWTLLVAACARPQWLGDPLELPITGRDLMLAVDVSGSMEEEDFSLNGRLVNRLEAVKAVASDFIERREGDRLGLILFGTRAYLQTPLTIDRKTVSTLLRETVIGLAGRDTAIGDAIGIAVKRLRETTDTNRVLILLTDGANTAGELQPLDAARLAKDAGVRIYTIGIGSQTSGLFGRRRSDFDPATLQGIADTTGGRFFEASDTSALAAIYDELDRIESTTRDTQTYRPTRALFYWPAGAALVLVLLMAMPWSMFGRWISVARRPGAATTTPGTLRP
ncbi:MAG: VWA domain-containing protein [Gammaproteobacteria bacterium]|nr:VWA domain-containing protein [Gammaproteobacteria bacterium]